jgi:hypothetical protein
MFSLFRLGYPTIFIDRQMLLEVLYNNLKSEASVLPGQKAESVKIFNDGIEVTTSKGQVYQGDILVGADGVYSTVRKEMWRIGHESSPGYFPADEWSSKIFAIPAPNELDLLIKLLCRSILFLQVHLWHLTPCQSTERRCALRVQLQLLLSGHHWTWGEDILVPLCQATCYALWQ